MISRIRCAVCLLGATQAKLDEAIELWRFRKRYGHCTRILSLRGRGRVALVSSWP
jgi:hypothetical protein